MAKWKPKDLKKYGVSRYKAIQVYDDICRRCHNKKRSDYHRYGGRGIKVKISRADFIDWYTRTVKGRTDLTVDRIDNDGHYELGNIQLITRSENSKKAFRDVPEELMGWHKKAMKIKINGIIFRSKREASRFLGKEESYVRNRIKRQDSKLPNGTSIIQIQQ